MKKRYFRYICLMLILMLGLTGCSSTIPDMTDAQREAISEYAVELLLKYDTNQKSRLVDLSAIEEEPEPTATPIPQPTATPEPSGMEEVVDTPVIEKEDASVAEGGDIKTVLGLPESISLEYVDCEVVDNYVDVIDESLVIEAGENKKLLVCNFVFVNDGAEKQSVDMLKESIKYVLNADGKTVHCLVTMLSNDLTTYMGILDADESRKVVVLAECEEEMLKDTVEIYLQVERGEETASVQVQ